jgi:hypothetical protein
MSKQDDIINITIHSYDPAATLTLDTKYSKGTKPSYVKEGEFTNSGSGD